MHFDNFRYYYYYSYSWFCKFKENVD